MLAGQYLCFHAPTWDCRWMSESRLIITLTTGSKDRTYVTWLEKKLLNLSRHGTTCQNSTLCDAQTFHHNLQTT
jgi:hypothetical protein